MLLSGGTISSAHATDPDRARVSPRVTEFLKSQNYDLNWVGRVGWANQGAEPGPDLYAFIDSTLVEIGQTLKVDTKRPVILVYCQNRGVFKRFMIGYAGKRPHLGVRAVAFPADSLVVIDGASREADPLRYSQTLVHELVHIVIGFARAKTPRWYHEGLAQELSHESIESKHEETLALWAHKGDLLPVTEIAGFARGNPYRVNIFYRQSYSFVRFLSRRYGPQIHAEILSPELEAIPLPLAIERATGESLEEIHEAWRAELARGFNLFRYLLQFVQPFTLLALVCAIGFYFQRRRRRLELERMARAEALEEIGGYSRSGI